MDKITTEFADVFSGIGCLEGEYRIEIKAYHLEPELEAKGIIASVERSTDWISSMVSVTKPNGT